MSIEKFDFELRIQQLKSELLKAVDSNEAFKTALKKFEKQAEVCIDEIANAVAHPCRPVSRDSPISKLKIKGKGLVMTGGLDFAKLAEAITNAFIYIDLAT